jgi:hypothetical protein
MPMETWAGEVKGQKAKKNRAARQTVLDKKLAIRCFMVFPVLVSVVSDRTAREHKAMETRMQTKKRHFGGADPGAASRNQRRI